ncbi:hypothetical protein M595_1616 [Lyngbya aestuarii BL J]|uniref:Hsp70 family protein n=1 Tax=Lyngbya aestuarii BL J TaxID=1348334 RepID=U7QMW8_9CYAN|nr:hypothetical protein [Lyngbya aestuarii]ERT08420.1 hypothetical protein M595_1616 [Lyngbya aestuarii BL J]
MSSPDNSHEAQINPDDQWYLALDIGAGVSACLLNRNSQKVYPIYWKAKTILSSDQENHSSDQVTFRLRCEVDWQETPNGLRQKLENFKPYLNIAIPYIRITQDSASEVSQVPIPLIKLSNNQTVFLGKFQRALQLLLSTLTPVSQPSLKGLMLPKLYTCGSVGLDALALHEVLRGLAGVIVGFPSQATEAYRFNVETAILGANLIPSSQQIFWLEDAIATLLGQLHSDGMISMSFGSALVIDAGATTTEIAIVELPDRIEDLTHDHFICHSWAYGGDALDLDIICQLLLNSPTGKQLLLDQFSDQDLIWPKPGHPDLHRRYCLQQQLQSQPLGVALLAAAKSLKVILSQQQYYTLEIEDYHWKLDFIDFERLVLVPFINQLNTELNHVIVKAGRSSIGINQALCMGGNGVWTGLNRWLRQKLPNAVICQNDSQQSSIDPRSLWDQVQVAMGLATLPLYPQVLDRSRHQYRDYFLLKELLNSFEEGQTLSIQQVIQVLESRGINTRSCKSRLQSILKDQLRLGLIPQEPEIVLIHPASRQTPDYQSLSQEKLFIEDGDQLYRLNLELADQVHQYLNQLFSGFPAYLEEPAIVSL